MEGEVSSKYFDNKFQFSNYLKDLLAPLPNEIVQEILRSLNEHELRWARLVNNRFFFIINITHFNIGHIEDAEMEELIYVFSRYTRPIGLTFRKPQRIIMNASRLERLTHLTALDFIDRNELLRFRQLTNLQRLTTKNPLVEIHHLTRLRDLTCVSCSNIPTQLERLEINTIKFDDQRRESFGHFPYLTELRVTCKKDDTCQFLQFMPNIRRLDMRRETFLPGVTCHLTGLESLCTDFAVTDLPVHSMTCLSVLAEYSHGHVNWDISHLTNLRQLHIEGARFADLISLLPFTLLQSLTLEDVFADKFLAQLISSNITQLQIGLRNTVHVTCLTSFTNLQQLSLKLGENGDFINFSTISGLTRLTSLKVCNVWGAYLSLCTRLTNLRELDLNMKTVAEDHVVLSQLTRLTSLVADAAAPTFDLSDLTNLEWLQLPRQGNHIIGLSTLRNLTVLDCGRVDIEQIPSLTALQKLYVSGNLYNDEIGLLSQLTRLTLLSVTTHDNGAPLARLTQLQLATVVASAGSNATYKSLRSRLVNCRDLSYMWLEDDESYNE